MPEGENPNRLGLLLDQNVPREVGPWLRNSRPHWRVSHTSQIGLDGHSDAEIFHWAQVNQCIVLTSDKDFADQRSFPVGEHCGVIRLRVWPTTVEEIQNAMARLLSSVSDSELDRALVIVGQQNIRVRASPDR